MKLRSNSMKIIALSGLLLVGFLYFANIAANQIQETNTEGTAFENGYSVASSLVSNSPTLVFLICLIIAGSGVLLSLKSFRSRRHY